MAFLDYSLWGNNIVQYALFLGVLIGTIIATRLVYFFVSKILVALTKKTKTKLDDLLVEALRKPIVLAAFVVGARYSQQFLTLTDKGAGIFGNVIMILTIFSVAWFISKFTNAILSNYIHPITKKSKSKVDDTIFPMVKKIVNFVIYAIALMMMLQNIGIQITGLMAGLGIGGLAFAMAAKDILSNTIAGGSILTDKPFKIGDRLKVEGFDGHVTRIGMRSTTLETFGKTQIIMPNARIANNVVENVSREDRRRVKIILGVEYGTSTKKLEQAKKLLHDIVKKNTKTDNDSLIHFIAFGPSSLDIQLIYWIKDLNQILATKDEINFGIKNAFEKAKIEFAFPSQTIYVKK